MLIAFSFSEILPLFSIPSDGKSKLLRLKFSLFAAMLVSAHLQQQVPEHDYHSNRSDSGPPEINRYPKRYAYLFIKQCLTFTAF